MQQTKSGETDLDALEILLANKDLSVKTHLILISNSFLIQSSFNIACSLIKNMIVMKKDEAARIAVKKMEEAGANDIKKNEPFVAIRAHLEAMDMFSKWSRLFNSSTPEDIQEITSGLTFVKVNIFQMVG